MTSFSPALNPISAESVYLGVVVRDDAERHEQQRAVSEEELVHALYDEHAGPLLRFALHLTSGDRQRAEDIVQETLLRAWQHPDAIVSRPARPWLFAVARNLAVDAHRARQARPNEVGDAALALTAGPDTAHPAPQASARAHAPPALRPDPPAGLPQ